MPDIKKHSLVKYYPKGETIDKKGQPVNPRPARVVDVNEKPPAVKVGCFVVPAKRKNDADKVRGPRKRRWLPAGWIAGVEKDFVPPGTLNT